jgi:hypothetical protein
MPYLVITNPFFNEIRWLRTYATQVLWDLLSEDEGIVCTVYATF